MQLKRIVSAVVVTSMFSFLLTTSIVNRKPEENLIRVASNTATAGAPNILEQYTNLKDIDLEMSESHRAITAMSAARYSIDEAEDNVELKELDILADYEEKDRQIAEKIEQAKQEEEAKLAEEKKAKEATEKEEVLVAQASSRSSQLDEEAANRGDIDTSFVFGEVPKDNPNDVIIGTGNEGFDEELEELARLVWAEDGNQPLESQEAIVDAVLNMRDDPNHPDTIHGVIHSGAFTVVSNGMINNATPSDLTYWAIRNELEEFGGSRNSYFVKYFRTKHFHTFGTPLFNVNNVFFSGS